MIYVINLLQDGGDGTMNATTAVADTEQRAMAIAKAIMLGILANGYYDDEDRPQAFVDIMNLTGLKEDMANDELLKIAWTLNMTIEDLWEIFFDYSLNFDDNPELEIRSLAENGMDSGGFWFSLGGQ